jgi:LmeA-like phospholipid-binding
VTAQTPEPYSYSDRRSSGLDDTRVIPMPRRKRHRLRWLLIVLVVLAGLLVAADRIALHVAQDELADKIAQQQHLSQKPVVRIDGFPFLTQAVTRNFAQATVDIRGLNAQGVPISDLHADLVGVHVSSGYNSAVVDTLTATSELNFTDLSKAVTAKTGFAQVLLSDGGNGEVKAIISLAGLINVSVQVHVTLLPGNVIELSSDPIKIPLSAPRTIDYKLSIGNLPFGVGLTSLTISQSGINIVALGKHVSLSQTSSGAY